MRQVNFFVRVLRAIFDIPQEELEAIAKQGEASVDYIVDRVTARALLRQQQFADQFQHGQNDNGNVIEVEATPARIVIDPTQHRRASLLRMFDEQGIEIPRGAKKSDLADILNAVEV